MLTSSCKVGLRLQLPFVYCEGCIFCSGFPYADIQVHGNWLHMIHHQQPKYYNSFQGMHP